MVNTESAWAPSVPVAAVIYQYSPITICWRSFSRHKMWVVKSLKMMDCFLCKKSSTVDVSIVHIDRRICCILTTDFLSCTCFVIMLVLLRVSGGGTAIYRALDNHATLRDGVSHSTIDPCSSVCCCRRLTLYRAQYMHSDETVYLYMRTAVSDCDLIDVWC